MLKKLGNKLKQDQKGMTLIELLAVIVILGIIAAIAVPSILGIINNSKKDAHVANAQQMLNAGKMLIASEATYQGTGPLVVSMQELEDKGYLDPVDSPTGNYDKGAASGQTDDDAASYIVLASGKITKLVLIDSANKGINETGAPLTSKSFDRNSVSW